jgi:hypothetical protein
MGRWRVRNGTAPHNSLGEHTHNPPLTHDYHVEIESVFRTVTRGVTCHTHPVTAWRHAHSGSLEMRSSVSAWHR